MAILVIEDEPRILAFVRRGLEAQGFAVDAAADGATGRRRARGGRYDRVVLDLLLPGLDGLAVLRELARTAPELPVVILSARADLQTRLRGFELGARRDSVRRLRQKLGSTATETVRHVGFRVATA